MKDDVTKVSISKKTLTGSDELEVDPISGICPVRNGRTNAMARYSAE